MNIGDYVRTKDDGIQKIVKVTENDCFYRTCTAGFDYHTSLDEEDIIKSSPNIIDLIEVGDYVNGYEVRDISYYGVPNSKKLLELDKWLGNCYKKIANEDIKSIITKEQIEQMEYKL